MAVVLVPHLQRIVEERVASGEYDSDEDVLREALELLVARDSDDARLLAALDQRVALGLAEADAGKLREFDASEIKRRARERNGL